MSTTLSPDERSALGIPIRPQAAQRPRTDPAGSQDDMSASEMSDKNPAGYRPYAAPNSTGGRSRGASDSTTPRQRRVESDASRRDHARPASGGAVNDENTSGGRVPRRTRGPVGDAPMSERITIRMTADEKRAVSTRAAVLRVSPSAWVRASVLDALDQRRNNVGRLESVADAAPDPLLAAAVEQLRRTGVNLNQALRRGAAVDADLVREVRSSVDNVRASLGDRTVT